MDTEKIKKRAYELYLEKGCRQGFDEEDWLKAEQDLKNQPLKYKTFPLLVYISQFLSIIVGLVTILAVLITANFVSVFAEIQYRSLDPIITIDTYKFYEMLQKNNVTPPPELTKIISAHADTVTVNDPLPGDMGLAWKIFNHKIYNAITGTVMLGGTNSEGVMIGPSDHIKYLLGLSDNPYNKPDKSKSLTDAALRAAIFPGPIRDCVSHNPDKNGCSGSRVRLEVLQKTFDSLPLPAKEKDDVWRAVIIAGKIYSIFVFENKTEVTAKGIKIRFDDAAVFGFKPKLLMANNIHFKYDNVTNSLLIPELHSKEVVLVLTTGGKVGNKENITVTWEKFGEIDQLLVFKYFIGILIFSLLIVCLDYFLKKIPMNKNPSGIRVNC